MKIKHLIILSVLAVLIALTTWTQGGVTLAATNQATQRPIGDFIDAQGTTSVFAPPAPDQLGWTTASTAPEPRFALFDYSGKVNAYLVSQGQPSLGTTVDGTVTERPLKDGRAEVQVILHTKRALTWVMPIDDSPDFASDPLSFGYRVQDILADPTHNQPALGNSQLQVVFINTAPGAPLPDLAVCLGQGTCPAGFEFVSIKFRGKATGPLRELAGLGPDGTRGRSIVTQVGNGATPDGFPVEKIELRRIGE